MGIDWSKAPKSAMGFHPQENGYVDHWVKWESSGKNWFCVCGFESGGWVKSFLSLQRMSSHYRSAIIERPRPAEMTHTFDNKTLNAWTEYANNFRQTVGVQSAQEAKLRDEISLQLFSAGLLRALNQPLWVNRLTRFIY